VKPQAIDLFSGCGGLTLGLRQAGFHVIAAVENDDLAVETYRANHVGVKVWHEDIRDLPVTFVMRHHGLRRGELDLLAGCPPCQGFSAMTTLNGKRRVRNAQNDLVSDFLRFTRQLLPKVVMLENVPRLRGSRKFREMRQGLIKLGYQCNYSVLNAADYGVPQRRRRFILVAARRKKVPFGPESENKVSVKEALRGLRDRPKNDLLHIVNERRTRRIQDLIRAIPHDGGSRKSLGKQRQLKCHRRIDGFKDIYGRMSWNVVAPTITGGCCNPSKGRFLHPTRNRTITLREAALLQSFPPKYFISMRRGKFCAAQLIGNALPPEFIRRHARSVWLFLRES
jgi:DNA (cytosine-5)-methyltransferase 1